jgi:GDP-L-fucose synthase
MKKYLYNLRGKNILIAGGSGLVGANLTKKVKAHGANVLSTYFSRKPSFLKENYRQADFTKFEDCIDATKGMDYVVICAASTFGTKMMQENPTVSILPNLKINAGLFEASRLNKVEKVIFISSSTVYQEVNHSISEKQLDLNKPPYELYFGVGWMNRLVEQLAGFYYQKFGIKIGIVRPTSIYGPYDNFDDERSHVIPALIKRALKKENPFVVWGDAAVVRDFIYVDDFINGLLEVLDRYCIADPINVGSGKNITIRAAVKSILNICKYNAIVRYDKSKPSAVAYRVLNTAKFDSIFGKKKRTPFDEGIRKTLKWYKSVNNGDGV